MESITAFVDGPLCVLCVYAFLRRTSYRYTVQLVLSLCQLYGVILYFLTEMKEGFIHGPYGDPLYFWFYFTTLNMIWVLIPAILIIESWREISRATGGADDIKIDHVQSRRRQENSGTGSLKKER